MQRLRIGRLQTASRFLNKGMLGRDSTVTPPAFVLRVCKLLICEALLVQALVDPAKGQSRLELWTRCRRELLGTLG